MPSFHLSASARRLWFRRCAGGVLLLAYVVTAAGVPLPMGTLPQKNGENFPCATSQCGCRTAEQCWQSCCCHTLAERVAWARMHGVRPPAIAVAQARAAGLDLSWLTTPGTTAQVCHSKQCCRSAIASTARSCCESKIETSLAKTAKPCCAHQHDAQPTNSTDNRVIVWQSLKCKGHSQHWLAAIPPLVVVHRDAPHDPTFSFWLDVPSSDRAAGVSQDPAVPPPRAV
jgi:hypothetical protein